MEAHFKTLTGKTRIIDIESIPRVDDGVYLIAGEDKDKNPGIVGLVVSIVWTSREGSEHAAYPKIIVAEESRPYH